MTTEKHQCSESVSGEGQWEAFHSHKCRKPGIVERERKWYCKIHDPEYRKAKSDALMEKWNKEAEARKQLYALQEARAKAVHGLTLSELQSLKPERVRASNELYEALKSLNEAYERIARNKPLMLNMLDKFDKDMYEQMQKALIKTEKAVGKADGGK